MILKYIFLYYRGRSGKFSFNFTRYNADAAFSRMKFNKINIKKYINNSIVINAYYF